MTTLENRRGTVLVVIDMQGGVVDGAYRRDAVIANINGLLARARDGGAAVVWVQHSDEELTRGSRAWELVPDLVPGASEPVVHKQHGDAFEGTDLERVLAGVGAGHLVVTGAETDVCVRATIHGAFVRGYDVTLVADAHTAGDKTAWGAPPVESVIAHTNLYWSFQSGPGKRARVVNASEVDFGA